MIQTIQHKGNTYPAFQASGNAARFIKEFAKEVCKGNGVDVGCNRMEWCFDGAFPVDPLISGFDAYNLPDNLEPVEGKCVDIYFNDEKVATTQSTLVAKEWDYIFSSHCLEHLPNWVEALDYWHIRLKVGGVVFLYLPNMDEQSYWCGWNNRKHIHYLTPDILRRYFLTQPEMWKNTFVSGTDLNSSFCVISEKV